MPSGINAQTKVETPPHLDEIAYLIHKGGKQIGYRTFFGVGFAPRAVGVYQAYYSRFVKDPFDPIFRDSAKTIFRHDNILGRFFYKYFLPKTYQSFSLSSNQIDTLRASGYKNIKRGARLMQVGNFLRVGGNLGGLFQLALSENDFKWNQALFYGLDALAGGIWFGVDEFLSRASTLVNKADQSSKVYLALRHARFAILAGDTLTTFAGAIKTTIEINNWVTNSKNKSAAALVDGVIDIGQGVSRFCYDSYFLKQASALALKGHINEANDALGFTACTIPTRLLWAMRLVGAVSACTGLAVNGYSIYQGLSDKNLTELTAKEKIVSGGIGCLASLFFLGGSYFITPASLPIYSLFILGGSIALAGQTYYDEKDIFIN